MQSKRSQVRFWGAVCLLLASMGALQVLSALKECEVWDEGFEIASGYSYLKTGRLRFNLEQPPLAKVLAAVPLLYLNPRLATEHPSWINKKDWDFGMEFIFHNRVAADTMVMAARCSIILLTIALGLLLATWTRRRFGAGPALLAVAFLAFDPNFLAHGHYATTDLAVTFFMFAACVAWDSFLTSKRKGHLFLAGISLGFAIGAKFSALILPPVFAALYLIRWWQQKERFSSSHLARSLMWTAATGYLALALVYLPEAKYFLPSWMLKRPGPGIETVVNPSNLPGLLLNRAGQAVALQANSFYGGLDMLLMHNLLGHPSYLLGQYSNQGWWYYFPVVFLVKTPTADLLLLAFLTCAGAALLFRRRPQWKLREVNPSWATVLAPGAAYFLASMTSHLDLGVRHLLPFYPFFFIAVSAGLFTLLRWHRQSYLRWMTAVICLLLVAESLAAYPEYLSFFNTVSGGTRNGQHYVVDSNIDWGQDLKKLKAYMDAHPARQYCLAYFGSADPAYYGIRNIGYLFESDQIEGRRNMDCMAAISVTLLYDLYIPRGTFSWLRERKPIDRVGGIWIYDLRQPHD